uniref:AMP-activated protein kinase glycogen-binding domain-containing protein n=1 Tax=Meloidogyne enterolobii TaxID=390850 RepID=A0A6V7V2Z1_MELEN|nr:unnamed protein product [Meloidogyne enterolobii]
MNEKSSNFDSNFMQHMVELSGRVLEIQNEFNIIKYNLKEEKNSNYEALEIKLKNMEGKNKFLEKEMEKANETIDALTNSIKTLGGINDALLIKKQPRKDRGDKSTLLNIENSLKIPMQKIRLDTNSNGDKDIFLIGSFLNWECALICDPIKGEPNKKGVLVELPVGRHEFCFICDGKWYTESKYEECLNNFGTKNNWIVIN